MEDLYLYIGMAALFLAQIGCFFAKKVSIRLIPTLIVAALILICALMYILSSYTNWGYLILLTLLFLLLIVMGILWLIFGLIRTIK